MSELEHYQRPGSIDERRQNRSSGKGAAIHFGVNPMGEDVKWVAMSATYNYGVGSNPTESTSHRIMAWATLRMDFDGVAVFKRGELARLCDQVDQKTGVLRPLNADSLNRAIGRLKERGYLGLESWSRVIYVSLAVAQNGRGRTARRQAIPRKPNFDGDAAPTFGGPDE